MQNEIKITAKPFDILYKITADDINNVTTSYQYELNKQLYEKYCLGIWEIENSTIKKEGNNMIESMNLIDLYANKHKEYIEKETKEKIEELRKKCDVINKYNELQEKYRSDLKELYLSQFTEEEIKEMTFGRLNDEDKQLRYNPAVYNSYSANDSFKPDGYEKLIDERSAKLNEVNDLVKMVKAHVGIAKTKEEVEEILTRYGIIDKKGKLVIKYE
jgi:hypothetical protein